MSSRFFLAFRHEFLAFRHLVLSILLVNDIVNLNIVSENLFWEMIKELTFLHISYITLKTKENSI